MSTTDEANVIAVRELIVSKLRADHARAVRESRKPARKSSEAEYVRAASIEAAVYEDALNVLQARWGNDL
jgi:hypothetical protein